MKFFILSYTLKNLNILIPSGYSNYYLFDIPTLPITTLLEVYFYSTILITCFYFFE